jgi:hypothetical protein
MVSNWSRRPRSETSMSMPQWSEKICWLKSDAEKIRLEPFQDEDVFYSYVSTRSVP